jgi:hypothetical protein
MRPVHLIAAVATAAVLSAFLAAPGTAVQRVPLFEFWSNTS